MKISITTFDPAKNTYVIAGTLDDGVFKKKCGQNHFMRINQSYAISEDAIKKLIELNCTHVEIITSNGTYHSNFQDDWLIPANKVMNYGSGPQLFCPVKKMQFIKKLVVKK